jgi:hypothetical protein
LTQLVRHISGRLQRSIRRAMTAGQPRPAARPRPASSSSSGVWDAWLDG